VAMDIYTNSRIGKNSIPNSFNIIIIIDKITEKLLVKTRMLNVLSL
jgi:hypothetical protein